MIQLIVAFSRIESKKSITCYFIKFSVFKNKIWPFYNWIYFKFAIYKCRK